MGEAATPTWVQSLKLMVDSTPQFVLTGNISDQYLLPGTKPNGERVLTKYETLCDALAATLANLGLEWVVVWDAVTGFRISPHAGDPEQRTDLVNNVFGVEIDERPQFEISAPLADLAPILTLVTSNRRSRGALVIDYASRLRLQLSQDHQQIHDNLFLVAERLSRFAFRHESSCPIFWLAHELADMPDWFVAGNEGLRNITIPLPDRATRAKAASEYFLRGLEEEENEPQEDATAKFVAQTHNQSLRSMQDIWRIATTHGYQMSRIDEAARAHRVGVLENVWLKPELKERLAAAEESLTRAVDDESESDWWGDRLKVFGQPRAIAKTLDVLKRSALGMSGAHPAGNPTRPRCVLFFAGPTGVGKTQLVKAINRIVFQSEEPLRFDMSEFSSVDAQYRLLGAPSDHYGLKPRGELANGVHENPFCVVSFDNIEMAHPRVLDKLLEVLRHGSLTDGAGQTACFSEAIIVFTSNLGMTVPEYADDRQVKGENGSVLMKARTNTGDFTQLVTDLNKAISHHFHSALGRPEFLNLIGRDNIVVFDYLSKTSAELIYDQLFRDVTSLVESELRASLEVSADAEAELKAYAVTDIEMGGRGIIGAIENAFVTPLAQQLFSLNTQPGARIRVISASAGHRPGERVVEVEVT